MEVWWFIPLLCMLSCQVRAQNLATLMALYRAQTKGGLSGGTENMAAGQAGCQLKSHKVKTKYIMVVHSRPQTMDCAPGTMFNITACSCVNIPKASAGHGRLNGKLIGRTDGRRNLSSGMGANSLGSSSLGSTTRRNPYDAILQQFQAAAGRPKNIAPKPIPRKAPVKPLKHQAKTKNSNMDMLRKIFQNQTGLNRKRTKNTRGPSKPRAAQTFGTIRSFKNMKLPKKKAKAPIAKPIFPKKDPMQLLLSSVGKRSGTKQTSMKHGAGKISSQTDIMSLHSNLGNIGGATNTGSGMDIFGLPGLGLSQSGAGGSILSALLGETGTGVLGGSGTSAVDFLQPSTGSFSLLDMHRKNSSGIGGLSIDQVARLFGETATPQLMQNLDASDITALGLVFGNGGASNGVQNSHWRTLKSMGVDVSDTAPRPFAGFGML